MLHSLNHPVNAFKRRFRKALGAQALKDFEREFRGHFVQSADLRRIADLGFNCIRVPFHYRLIEKSPYVYDSQGVKYLDDVIGWAKSNKVWVILDLHAAPGCQNHDWHSDSDGKCRLWDSPAFQKRTASIWAFLAKRYRDEPAVAGYDLLNEAVCPDMSVLNDFYQRIINAIRKVDPNHILFVEGSRWATDLSCLKTFDDDNLALSAHFYNPIDFTLAFVPGLSYPIEGTAKQEGFNKTTIKGIVSSFQSIARQHQRPVLVGEFGVNVRDGFYGEDQWLKDVLDCFHDADFHWTYWSYKAVKNAIFPDGLFSYYANPPWVNRMGPRLGWDNFAQCWDGKRSAMIDSWETKHFTENTHLTKVLMKAAKRKK